MAEQLITSSCGYLVLDFFLYVQLRNRGVDTGVDLELRILVHNFSAENHVLGSFISVHGGLRLGASKYGALCCVSSRAQTQTCG